MGYIVKGVLFQGVKAGFRVFAVLEEEAWVEKKSTWGPLFDVADPRSKAPQYKGKFLDVNQALEVARYDIQYCDWRARQDVLTIMLLHEKVPIEFQYFMAKPICDSVSNLLFLSFLNEDNWCRLLKS